VDVSEREASGPSVRVEIGSGGGASTCEASPRR
jgi:hypothetical protein